MNAGYFERVCNMQCSTHNFQRFEWVPTYLSSTLCFTLLQFPVWIRATSLRFEFQSATCCLYQRISVFNFRVHFQDLTVSCTLLYTRHHYLVLCIFTYIDFFCNFKHHRKMGGAKGKGLHFIFLFDSDIFDSQKFSKARFICEEFWNFLPSDLAKNTKGYRLFLI